MKYKIFLNSEPFAASGETLDQLETALFKSGWRWCKSSEGWDCPKTVAANKYPNYERRAPATETG